MELHVMLSNNVPHGIVSLTGARGTISHMPSSRSCTSIMIFRILLHGYDNPARFGGAELGPTTLY